MKPLEVKKVAIQSTTALNHLSSKCRTYRCWINIYHRAYTNKAGKFLQAVQHEKSWKNYENFLQDMGEAPSEKHTITRKNPMEGFTKSNCIWQTKEVKEKVENKTVKKYKKHEKFLSVIGAETGIYGTKHELYRTWYGLLHRCYNPESKGYPAYKNRKPPESWLSFKNFLADVGERPQKNMSLDRVDNSKPYSKENVRWATAKQQADNKSTNIKITYNDQIYTIEELSVLLGIDYGTLNHRRQKDWPISQLVKKEPDPEFLKARAELGKAKANAKRGIFAEIDGKRMVLKDWARAENLNYKTLKSRVQRGQDPSRAVRELIRLKPTLTNQLNLTTPAQI